MYNDEIFLKWPNSRLQSRWEEGQSQGRFLIEVMAVGRPSECVMNLDRPGMASLEFRVVRNAVSTAVDLFKCPQREMVCQMMRVTATVKCWICTTVNTDCHIHKNSPVLNPQNPLPRPDSCHTRHASAHRVATALAAHPAQPQHLCP